MYEMNEHAIFMGWKAVLCTVLEMTILWDMMLCSRVDRDQFVASVFIVVHEEHTVWLENPYGRNYFEVVIDGRKILKLILTLVKPWIWLFCGMWCCVVCG